MTGGRLRVFLSSTQSDLAECTVARHVCFRLGIDIEAMVEFGPDTRAAVELCRSKVADADVFLGLYA